MSIIAPAKPRTVADLVRSLSVPPERIRLDPHPGEATELDAIRNKMCELIDGTLVEKAMGYYESRVAIALIYFLERYFDGNPIGFLLDSAGMIRVAEDQVRLPDVSVFLWNRFSGRKLPPGQVLDMVPDLPVEILSPTNTEKEMARKRVEYFAGGAKLVWEVDPIKRSVEVYTAADVSTVIDENGTLDGGNVLPGFALPIRAWFERAGERAE
ncbi:MAG TPA: Uma2 family endonuclease [Gemmataceae bacterium]|nr:Uma2 family endonuclease [Gemmataceae bacterium]